MRCHARIFQDASSLLTYLHSIPAPLVKIDHINFVLSVYSLKRLHREAHVLLMDAHHGSFGTCVEPDVDSWMHYVKSCAHHTEWRQAVRRVDLMQRKHGEYAVIKPDAAIFNLALSACQDRAEFYKHEHDARQREDIETFGSFDHKWLPHNSNIHLKMKRSLWPSSVAYKLLQRMKSGGEFGDNELCKPDALSYLHVISSFLHLASINNKQVRERC